MIARVIDEAGAQALHAFCERDAFGAKISAYLTAYGTELQDIGFYVQKTDEAVVTAMGQVDGALTLCTCPQTDWEELNAFLGCLDFHILQCEKGEIPEGLSLIEEGHVVHFIKAAKPANPNIKIAPCEDYREMYSILTRCDFTDLGNYGDWAADLHRRVRTETAFPYLAYLNGEAVGCAGVLFLTNSIAFMGAVGTLPQSRGQRVGGTLVCALAEEMQAQTKEVYLFCKPHRLSFYESIGFESTGSWMLLRKEFV